MLVSVWRFSFTSPSCYFKVSHCQVKTNQNRLLPKAFFHKDTAKFRIERNAFLIGQVTKNSPITHSNTRETSLFSEVVISNFLSVAVILKTSQNITRLWWKPPDNTMTLWFVCKCVTLCAFFSTQATTPLLMAWWILRSWGWLPRRSDMLCD